MKSIRTKSGLVGWQARLREVYPSLGEFEEYCAAYNIHTRIGYETPVEAWIANPLIEGSVNPSDLRRVRSVKKQK